MRIRSLIYRVLALPLSTWVLLAFALSYLLFFVTPIFLSTNVMQFYRYVPAAEHIGIDLKQTLSFSAYWLAPDQLHYVRSNNYPPLASLLFVPLLAVKFPAAFQIVTWSSVLAYAVIALVLAPRLGSQSRHSSLPVVFCLAGLLSYGFQFELERGQFDVLAILPALLAIWLYHRRSSQPWLAYALFSLSVQLKLYPLIFIVMFIRDWRAWRANLRRILFLLLANVLLLFAFGAGVFTDFFHATTSYVVDPFIWVGNHSIRSAVTLALRYADRHGLTWLDPYTVSLQAMLLVLVGLCLLLIVLRAYRSRSTGLNPYLLLAVTLGALLIPSFSHDYRLTILAGPALALLLAEQGNGESSSPAGRIAWILMIFLLSFAYSSTMFSYTQKPFLLANNFPALMAMLIAVTVLALLSHAPAEGQNPGAVTEP